MKPLLLLMAVLPILWAAVSWAEKYMGFGFSKKKNKYNFRGTNRQDNLYKIEEELESAIAKWVPISVVRTLRRAGIDSLGEFILQLILILLIVIAAIVLILWFLPQYRWVSVGPILLLFTPVLYVAGKLKENERNLILQSPIFTSIISREFSRYNNMEQAFRRAGEETSGWTQVVFKKMVDYMDAVRGDVDGALEIFRSLNEHTVADQFYMSIKQGLATNQVHDALASVSKNALLAKKRMEVEEAKKNDSIIFANAIALFLVLMAQVGYYAFSDFSFLGFKN
jgi:Flp pilus assembly protein TadB